MLTCPEIIGPLIFVISYTMPANLRIEKDVCIAMQAVIELTVLVLNMTIDLDFYRTLNVSS